MITVYTGEVRLAGAPLSSLTERAAGRLIGYAGPEPVVFSGTVRDNVVYGLFRAVHGLAAVLRAAARARSSSPRTAGWTTARSRRTGRRCSTSA